MITRHFYESEEVELALAYAIRRGRHVEAAFWCEELVCSEEEALAWGVLYRTWLEQCLLVVPDWADTWLSSDSSSIHEACAELCDACSCCCDVSLPLLMILPYEPAHPPLSSELQAFFQRSVAAATAQDAWWATLQLGAAAAAIPFPLADRLFGYLETLDLPGPPSLWLGATMCAAVLLQCAAAAAANPYGFKRTGYAGAIGRAPHSELAAMRSLTGRRARRLFPIPRECLLCTTPRGRAPSTANNLPALYSVQERLLKGEGCSFWNRTLMSLGIYKQRPESKTGHADEAVEAFYAFAFPDDIPDEWSKEDQMQSHGPGTLSKNEEPRWTKWGHLWLDGALACGIPARPSSTTTVLHLLPPTPATQHWLQALPVCRTDLGPVASLTAAMDKITRMEE